jgi:hypothetical protein
VLCECLASSAHEPFVVPRGAGSSAGDTLGEVLRECALLAPQAVASAVHECLADPAVTPLEGRPTDVALREAFGLMFPALTGAPVRADAVGSRDSFNAAVARLSYAGVRGRLDDGGHRGGRGHHGEGDSDNGEPGSDEEEEERVGLYD